MPAVLTVLRAHVDARHARRVRALLDEAEGTVGAPDVIAEPDAGRLVLVTAFHLASEAAAVAVRMAAATGGTGLRVALATGEVDRRRGRLHGPARQRVDALATAADDPRVLLSASTAVMVSHTLPPGLELVDAGPAGAAGPGGERAYELRVAVSGNGEDDAGASNTGWALRATARRIVGRATELARLERAWAEALAGRARLVVVSGDPGIGKTTLAAELALRVQAASGTVLYGRWDDEGHEPHQAVREALGTYAATCPLGVLRRDVADRADDLARLLPAVGARIGGVRPPLADDPEAERLRLFDAVRDWLGAIARRHPVLLVLDDLQWAERSSLLLLRHLRDTPPDGPVLIVVTLRDGDVEGMGPLHTLGSFEGDAAVDRIDVRGLELDAVAELVTQALGRAAGDVDEVSAARWLSDETAGNPLLLHEILGGLDPTDPAADLDRARRELPERVHDVVRWRLARLSPETNEALRAASFVGEEFSLGVLAAALGRRVIDLRHRLDGAVRAGVVRDGDDGQRLVFAHAVVRRAVHDEVDPDQAADLHRRIASVLADGSAGSAAPAEIAHHYLRAAIARPDPDTAALAIRWGRAAADQARRETAFESAVWFLGRVLEVHDRAAREIAGSARDPELGCELRLDLADAHDRAGEFLARDRRHLEAADLARELGRTDLFVRAALGYGGRLPAAPPPNPTARGLLDEALVRLPPDDSRARALVLARLAHVLHEDAPHAERKAIADEAEAMARRLDAPVVLASVLSSRVLALDGPDDVDEHLDIGEEVIRIGEHTGDPDLVLQGARARIHPLFVVGAHDAARDLADRFTDLASTVRHPDHLRIAAMWRTMWAALEGRFDEAEAQADRLRIELEMAGHWQTSSIHFAQTFAIRWLRGQVRDAGPAVEAARYLDPSALGWWSLQCWIAAGSGDEAAARALLADHEVDELAAADAGYLWLLAVVGVAVTAATLAEPRWAAAAHDTLAPYSGRNCVLGYAAFLGAVDHHLGTLDAAVGRTDEAVHHLEAALDRHRVIGARPWVALSAAWLANVLADRDRRGDADRASALHGEAAGLAAELGITAAPPPHPRLSG
ncbi:MAG TPA: AAA family ATPase [Acidimicrobiales bacterium]